MVVALAGRRIDEQDAAYVRFPLENQEVVHDRIRDFLKDRGVRALVCSAACGADLLALGAARDLGIRQRVIVLPFEPAKFRRQSVTDRPGDWGSLYDRELSLVERGRELVILRHGGEDDASYMAANSEILNQAVQLGRERGEAVQAAVVWDGKSRGAGDTSEQFLREARERNLPVCEIPTLA